ncbi:uncharacterized protein NPIL_194391 [Nephila pilipes]|uniref:Uncharacterized protein n=1 Tax=Nephila pilipes TaxID=299642 RepID=A0A8X6PWT3_NEPPI|nr:uncharacterized protein NPIL_194391 [Nephila pilipes]
MNRVPSLEHMTLVKISVTIINITQVSDYVGSCIPHRCDGVCCLDERERIIRQIISSCAIPEVLLQKILRIIRPMHCEVQRWRRKNAKQIFCRFVPMNNICWNFLGTIDYVETAKKLVRSEDFFSMKLFPVACAYWLTNDVVRLWKELSRFEREILKTIYTHDIKYKYCPVTKEDEIMKQWICWLEDGAVQGNLFSYVGELIYLPGVIPPPVEIWQKLLPGAAENLQKRILAEHFDTSIGRDYVSNMDASLRMKLFEEDPYSAISMFSRWPLQTEFFEIANRLYPSLNGHTFDKLIHTIIFDKCAPCQSYFDYKNLQKSFWNQSPETLKKEAEMSPNAWVLQKYNLI